MSDQDSRVLVIDDDGTSRRIVSRQLESAGYEVHTAEDGREGVARTRELQPRMVLCDWVMPRLDGPGYCREIKNEASRGGPYVTLLTTRADRDDLIEGLDAGADDFLVKPLDRDELLARVRAGLRIRRLQERLLAAERREIATEMAVTLAHEVNNPLMVLMGHIELLQNSLGQDEDRDDQRSQRHAQRISEAAAEIAQVARALTELRDPETKPYLAGQRMLDLALNSRN